MLAHLFFGGGGYCSELCLGSGETGGEQARHGTGVKLLETLALGDGPGGCELVTVVADRESPAQGRVATQRG